MHGTKLSNGTYEYYDNVNGGYLNRGQCAYYDITSIWNKDLELLSLIVDGEDFIYIKKDKNQHKSKKEIIQENKSLSNMWDFHYMRAIRGKNRHLKLLRIDLGLDNVEEIKKEAYVYRDYFHGEICTSERELTKKELLNLKDTMFLMSRLLQKL